MQGCHGQIHIPKFRLKSFTVWKMLRWWGRERGKARRGPGFFERFEPFSQSRSRFSFLLCAAPLTHEEILRLQCAAKHLKPGAAIRPYVRYRRLSHQIPRIPPGSAPSPVLSPTPQISVWDVAGARMRFIPGILPGDRRLDVRCPPVNFKSIPYPYIHFSQLLTSAGLCERFPIIFY